MAACKHRRLVYVPLEDQPEILAEVCLDCHTTLDTSGPDDPELRAIGESLFEGPPRGNPPRSDKRIRDLERRVAAGDGVARLELLRELLRAGRLPANPEVDTIVAYHSPDVGDWPFNEWAGGGNELEFVESALEAARVMTAQGGRPYLISSPWGDYDFEAGFGSDVNADMIWLSETYQDMVRRARG